MRYCLALLFVIALAVARIALADPLDVTFDNPPSQPVFIGYTTTLAIHLQPTAPGGSVTGLSAQIQTVIGGGVQLVSEDCPGDMAKNGGVIDWTGMGDLLGGAAIDCGVVMRPTVDYTFPIELRLAMDCDGCSGDADDRDSAFMETALAPDVVATIVTNPNPPVGAAALTVLLVNEGEGTAYGIPVALYGDMALFGAMAADGVGKCLTDYALGADSATWSVGFMDPGEELVCPFTFTIPSAGSYTLNLSAPAQTEGGLPEPNAANNFDSVTLNATDLVVDTRFSFDPDANPGDGICADDNGGECSLRAAVEEANALAGHQVISVPYRADGYYLTGLNTYLTITDPVTLSGVPDTVTGNYPFISRDSSLDVGIIKVDTGSTTDTVIEQLDLRGDSDNELSVDGAVIQHISGDLWIRQAKISGGWTSGSGGGIRGAEGLRLSGVEIFNNTADSGAGLYVLGVYNNGIKDAFIEGSAFHDNHAEDPGSGSGTGGGALFINADTDVERSSFVENTADKFGGGMMISTNADVRLTNTTFHANTAVERGGGIYHAQGQLEVNFSTLTSNVAGPGDNTSGDGGGIWTDGASATDIRNSILAFNLARTTGGMFGLVVSGNCHGTLDSHGYNTITFIDSDSDCSSAGFTSEDNYTTSPGLAPPEMTDSGVSFRRLTKVGAEIDQASEFCDDIPGNPVTMDIRRVLRPREGDGEGGALCDRGAVESVAKQLHITTTETGPALWQILVDGERPSCLEPMCSYYLIPAGSTVSLTPDPGPSTSFDGWGDDCAAAGTGICELQMSETRNVSAGFTSLASPRTLTVNVTGAGSVTSSPNGILCPGDCEEDFPQGTMVTLTAIPDPGQNFVGWSNACAGLGECVVDMSNANTVGATFQPEGLLNFANGFE